MNKAILDAQKLAESMGDFVVRINTCMTRVNPKFTILNLECRHL